METIQCSKCGAVFEKTGAKDKLRRFKDKRFMTTFHCPNCDARVILKNGEEPDTIYLKRLERLKEQARRLGDNQEVRELQDEIDQINREIKMNAGKTKDKKFSVKGKDAYDPTTPKNIAKAKALSVAQGKAASDEEAYDPLDPENILKEKELAKARGAAAADVKDSLFKGQKVTAIKSEQGLREGETYTVLGEEEIIKQIVGENNATVYKLQDSSGNIIVIECGEGLFYEAKDADSLKIKEEYSEKLFNKLWDELTLSEKQEIARHMEYDLNSPNKKSKDSKTKDENESLKVKIGDIKKNMDAARKMGFDTAPYQKEIDKLETKTKDDNSKNGYYAGITGKARTENPFTKGTPEYAKWDSDWKIGNEDFKYESNKALLKPKDSKAKDAVRPELVEVGKTLFYRGREGNVVSVNGNKIVLDIDGEIYTVNASECHSGTTGDSKTKDFVDPSVISDTLDDIKDGKDPNKAFAEALEDNNFYGPKSKQDRIDMANALRAKGVNVNLAVVEKMLGISDSKAKDEDKELTEALVKDAPDYYGAIVATARRGNNPRMGNQELRKNIEPFMASHGVQFNEEEFNKAYKEFSKANVSKAAFMKGTDAKDEGAYKVVTVSGKVVAENLNQAEAMRELQKYEKENDELCHIEKQDSKDSSDVYTKDPLTKKGEKILAAMKKAYGEEKGEQIFYASKNKGTISGVDKKTKDQEIKIIIGEDPVNPSPAEQKVESNDVIYKEYTLKQLPETGEFEIYAPGGSIVGHAKALELAKLFVDRIIASKVMYE